MTRLLIVSQHFWPESFRINDLVLGLLSAGIDIDVLCGLPNYPTGVWFSGYDENGPFYERYHGARVYRCKEIPRKGNTAKSIFLNYVSWPLFAKQALEQLPGDYDAIICYNTSPVLMMWPAIHASQKFQAPLINYVFDLWPENLYSVLSITNPLLRGLAQATSDYLYSKADRIITLSEGMKNNLIARIGFTCPHTCIERFRSYAVIPQYCEDFYAAGPTRKPKQDNEDFVLMFTGNLSPAQDLEGVMESVAEATQFLRNADKPRKLSFVIYGDGMSRDAIEDAITRFELDDTVTLMGHIPATDIPNAIQSADALLVSLRNSPDLGLTVPSKLASSMAARKPLLVSITGEGARAARESGGALVCDAGDRHGLAANLIAMALTPKDLLDKMGDNSFAYYQARYKRDTIIRDIISFVINGNSIRRDV